MHQADFMAWFFGIVGHGDLINKAVWIILIIGPFPIILSSQKLESIQIYLKCGSSSAGLSVLHPPRAHVVSSSNMGLKGGIKSAHSCWNSYIWGKSKLTLLLNSCKRSTAGPSQITTQLKCTETIKRQKKAKETWKKYVQLIFVLTREWI